ncbi:hypothetical protein PCO80_15075 [Pectobacteriaceae bacterium C80]|nr:hypothetical protein PCO80_15075 [Pectobacteriaceae bacterium C80]
MNSLITHVFTVIGKRNVSELKTCDLLVPLKKAEATGHIELALRLQQRITAIMRYAAHNALIEQHPAYDLAGAVVSTKSVHLPALSLEICQNLCTALKLIKEKASHKLQSSLHS